MSEAVPLLSCAQAAELEARLLPDEPAAAEAMQRAGTALAEAVERDFAWWRPWPEAPRVLVLAGKGHNAGDALIATTALAVNAPNLQATVVWIFGEEGLKPNLAAARDRLRETVGENLLELTWSEATPAALEGRTFDVTFDGIVGMQFRAPWRAPGEAAVQWTLAHAGQLGFRVAVDLPSGLGDAPAETVFAADVTYATGSVKAPVLAEGAAASTGRVRLLDLGFFADAGPELPGEAVGTDGLLRAIGRLRPAASDKRVYGQVFVLGGSQRFPGAVTMATQAAVRGGAGLVTAFVPTSIAPFLAAAAVEAMWQPLQSSVEGSLAKEAMRQITTVLTERGVLLIGPGLLSDRNNTFLVCRLIREVSMPLVLDAGALGADMVNALMGRPPSAGPVIVTPHFGE